jgi:uncharacterized membrane protein YfcA
MGIGGGVFGVSLLTAFGRPIQKAIGTASGFGLAIGLPAAVTAMFIAADVEGLPPLSVGYVNIPAFLFISSITVVFVPYGAKLAHSMDALHLKRAFALLLLITATIILSKAL